MSVRQCLLFNYLVERQEAQPPLPSMKRVTFSCENGPERSEGPTLKRRSEVRTRAERWEWLKDGRGETRREEKISSIFITSPCSLSSGGCWRHRISAAVGTTGPRMHWDTWKEARRPPGMCRYEEEQREWRKSSSLGRNLFISLVCRVGNRREEFVVVCLFIWCRWAAARSRCPSDRVVMSTQIDLWLPRTWRCSWIFVSQIQNKTIECPPEPGLLMWSLDRTGPGQIPNRLNFRDQAAGWLFIVFWCGFRSKTLNRTLEPKPGVPKTLSLSPQI